MKISVNKPCPCGSKEKYKNCCQKYHKGAKAKNALLLMKSRYSAYVVGDARYIINTTHHDNPDYQEDKKAWQKSINSFTLHTDFKALNIESFEEKELEAYVTFKASSSDGTLYEKSYFVKEGGVWFYYNGVINKII